MSEVPRSSEEVRLGYYRRVLAICGLLLVGTSYKLWLPQTDYPQVPVFSALVHAPAMIDYVLAVGIIGSLLAWLVTPNRQATLAAWSTAMCIAASCLLDQHRFQPWAYQLIFSTIILATCEAKLALRLLRMIVISIYVYSSLSKLNLPFMRDEGQMFLDVLLGWVGAKEALAASVRQGMTLLFPLGELTVGVLLAIPRTRKLGVIFAAVMHTTLLLVVGPLGLNHWPGVLLWNLCFLAQAPLLFWPMAEREGEEPVEAPPAKLRAVGIFAASFVLLFPLLEPLGYCDAWPGWALYASHVSRADLYIDDAAAEALPEKLRPFLVETEWGAYRLDASQWSLHALNVPIYPDDRFQVGVAIAASQRYGVALFSQMSVQDPADRWRGERTETRYRGPEQMKEATKRFWLNAEPRDRLAR
ncbi:hypothetical protein LOC68_16330 [Blastopirellula sp. JC732]|uniref:Uncharacterized protein n=1 Tax=Blastopirellula sediminis TaxID=2894196 RepID=A0A9X1MPG3_9BACT|nr:hypothetical protein [Blastopirellula sediminis]MCC9606743.1 hypothetical protein [Blastopirellula sediminis]MCC9629960.1 hypothetical protein [Blastopirellula sediminis]